MKRLGQRKCRHCGAWFRPDPRNARHQRYCSEPACRQASKAASQRQWLAKPENQDYFRGTEPVARVRRWRAEHPGYWRRARQNSEKSADALQEDCRAQTLSTQGSAANSEGAALQEVLPTNFRALSAFRHHVEVLWMRALRRRSQKDRTPWARLGRIADSWLPCLRILHPWPSERFAVKHPR